MDQPDQIGRFRIRRVLGRGAMGVVYLAEDPVLGREVAIKAIQLHPGLSEQQLGELRQRFETEAKAAAKLTHPNLVTIYDAGLEEENLYIAMEFVEGEGLDSIVESGRRLSADEIGRLVGQLASALDYAHSQGIVHRDIKPANVLVSNLGHAKITDFGVARQAASTLTATGAMIGTPAYMSPEQVTGETVSGASDQFSLAIMVYELLTGERPFVGEGATTILYKIVHEAPQQPNAVRPDLNTEIDGPVLRAMSKDPGERFESCSEFALAVCEALGVAADPSLASGPLGKAEPAPEPEPGLATDPDAATSLDASTGGTSQRQAPEAPSAAAKTAAAAPAPQSEDGEPRQLPWIWIAAGAVVVGLLGVWMFGGGSEEPATTGPDLSAAAEAIEQAQQLAEQAAEMGVDLSGVPGIEQADTPGESEAAGVAVYRFTTRPDGARMMFNGELVSESTPVELEIATGEEHTVLIEHAGYETVSWRFVAEELPEELQESRELFFPLRSNEPEEVAEVAVAAEEASSVEASPGVSISQELLPPVDPVRVRGSMEPPELVERGDNPEFPEWAIEQGLQRYVILELVIDREGRIRDARPLQAVHPDLERLAVAAVRGWTFQPATDDGEAVDVYHNVSVQFDAPDGNRRLP